MNGNRKYETPWTAACQAPLSMGFSRQEYWSGVPLPSPMEEHKMHKIIPERNTNFAHCSFCNSSMLLSYKMFLVEYFAVVQSLTHVWLFVTPWTAACQASLPFTISWSLLKLMSIESVMPSSHPLSPPSPSAFNLSQSYGFFKWVGSSKQVA